MKAQARRVAGSLLVTAVLAGVAAQAEQAEPQLTGVCVRTPRGASWTLALPGQWIYVSERSPHHAVYRRGRDLLFQEEGNKLSVRIDGGPAQVACIVVETAEHLAELRRLLAGGARDLVVLTTHKGGMLAKLPVLPADRGMALAATNCRETDPRTITAQTGITALKLCGWDERVRMDFLPRLTHLESLAMRQCTRLDLSDLAQLRGLSVLELDRCSGIAAPALLARMPRLVGLSVSADEAERPDFAGLAALTRLRWLRLRPCHRLGDLSPLAKLTQLEHLEVEASGQVSDLAPLAGLTRLRRLSVAHCTQVRDLTPLLELPRLAGLSVAGCRRINTLTTVAQMPALKEINLRFCRGFSDLTPLAGVTRPLRLDLRQCSGVRDLAPLKATVRAGAEVLVDDRLQEQLAALRKTDF